MRVHVSHSDGEAKFWLTPDLALATNIGLSPRQLKEAERLVTHRPDRLRPVASSSLRSGAGKTHLVRCA